MKCLIVSLSSRQRRSMSNIFAFADEYDMVQLRNDVLTVAIELDWAWRIKYDAVIAHVNVARMCDMLQSSAKLYDYIA
jgi:hypothetical protein